MLQKRCLSSHNKVLVIQSMPINYQKVQNMSNSYWEDQNDAKVTGEPADTLQQVRFGSDKKFPGTKTAYNTAVVT